MPYKMPLKNGIAVPNYEIFLNGKEMPGDYYDLVEEVTYESHASGSDIATIFIKDPYMRIINDPRIVRGMRITLNGGWISDLSKWLDGYISMVDVEFPETGDPTITLHCMDESFLLDRQDVKMSYSNVTFSQLAEMVGRRNGSLTARGTETSTIHEELSQSDESDMKFLIRMADEENLVVKVVNGTITWKPKDAAGTSQDTLTWRKPPFSIISFSPRITLANAKKEVEKAEINSDSMEVEQGKADDSTSREVIGDKTIWEREEGKYTQK